jgi:hypothetical protein
MQQQQQLILILHSSGKHDYARESQLQEPPHHTSQLLSQLRRASSRRPLFAAGPTPEALLPEFHAV